MKLERLNENQIRVYLTSGDLCDRGLSLNELARGTEKGRELFAELMYKIKEDYDFPSDGNNAVIVEALPVSMGDLIVIISAVTGDFTERFGNMFQMPSAPPTLGAKKFISKDDCPFLSATGSAPAYGSTSRYNELLARESFVYEFETLDDVCLACGKISPALSAENALYKMSGKYYLVINAESGAIFTKATRILSEYGVLHNNTGDRIANSLIEARVKEYGELIMSGAMRKLADL